MLQVRLIKAHKEDREPFFNKLVVLIIIYISADTLLFGTNSSDLMQSIRPYCAMGLFTVFLGIVLYKKYTFKSTVLVSVLMVACVLINFLIANGQNSVKDYVYQILLIAVCVLFVRLVPFRSFSDIFIKIITVLSLLSFIIFLIGRISPSLLDYFPSVYNISDVEFKSLLVSNVPVFSWFNGRNYSIFREPGVAQFYFNIALLFSLVTEEKPKPFRMFILVVGIFTTFSTAGLICLALIFLMLLFKRYGRNKKHVRYMLFVIILLLVVSFLFSGDLMTYTFNKLILTEDDTTASRYQSIIINIKMWLQGPIFGIGSAECETMFKEIAASQTNSTASANTNTFLYLFACYGFIFGCAFFVGCLRFCKYLSDNSLTAFILLLVVIILLSSQNLYRSYIPFIIMSYGYQLYGTRRNVRSQK